MDTHKNAPLTPKGRQMMVRAVADCGLSKAAAASPVQHDPEDRRQVAPAVLGRGRGRFARPVIETAFIAKPSDAGRLLGGREFAPAAPYRQGDRGRDRGLAGDRQSRSEALGPEQAERPGAGRAGAPL